jgi:hypothetical protein
MAMPMTRGGGRTMTQPVRHVSRLWPLLLACGILASLLYAATDVLGGLRYEGYSFGSQTISELAAVGVPSEGFVRPLFLAYDVLALAFAIAVFHVGTRRNRALRITGALLIAHAAIGLASAAAPTFFSMRPRGTGGLGTDAPHIVLMSVIVLLLFLAIGFGAFALGQRFRIFSFVSLTIALVFGALIAPFSTRVAAGELTPGLGIIERINVYSIMLWLAVLAIALLRRSWHGETNVAAATTRMQGVVAPGFEEVRAEFERNFAERGESRHQLRQIAKVATAAQLTPAR